MLFLGPPFQRRESGMPLEESGKIGLVSEIQLFRYFRYGNVRIIEKHLYFGHYLAVY